MSAICTNTLELGIDIGAVKVAAQIRSPPSRGGTTIKRLRSGRRKEPSCVATALDASAESLRWILNSAQDGEDGGSFTMLLEGGSTAPMLKGAHLSDAGPADALVHRAQNGGAAIERTACCAAVRRFRLHNYREGRVRRKPDYDTAGRRAAGSRLSRHAAARAEWVKAVETHTFCAAFARRLPQRQRQSPALPVTETQHRSAHPVCEARPGASRTSTEEHLCGQEPAGGSTRPDVLRRDRPDPHPRSPAHAGTAGDDVCFLDEIARFLAGRDRLRGTQPSRTPIVVETRQAETLLLTWFTMTRRTKLANAPTTELKACGGPGVEVAKAAPRRHPPTRSRCSC